MKKILFMMLGVLIALPAFARDFTYEYGGQTLTYTVLDENAKTCKTKDGSSSRPGNKVSGNLVLPANPKDGEVEYTLTTIGDLAFYDCSGLTSVSIPNTVTSIGDYAFALCSGLTSVSIPNTVTSIGDYAFARCSGLTSVSIPNTVTSIGYAAFYKCSGLTSVNIPESVTSIGDYAFSGCSGLTSVNIPESVTTIGYSAFSGCSGLTSVNIPNSVTSIGDYAFARCSGLTSVNIPESVTSIGESAFEGCSGLTSVNIPESVTSIGYYAFKGCSGLTSISIPNSVTSIGESAFYNCSGLKTLIIEDADTELKVGASAFDSAPLENLTIGRNWKYSDGRSAMSTSIKNLTLTNGVTVVPYYAFDKCSGLTSVTIPNSVTSIGKNAFSYCSGLKTLIIEDGDTELKIGASAFASTPIENLTIGRNWTGAMSTDIKNLTLTNGVTAIPNSAFRGCSGLTSVNIPESVTSIGDHAFYKCSGLTSVNIPNSVTSIGDYAFSDCSGLTSVNISESVTSIGEFAFSGCSGLTSISISNTVKTIGVKAFLKCSGLTSVNIPNSVTSIGEFAFCDCSRLKTLIIEDGDTELSVGNAALYSCPIENLTIGRNWTYGGSLAMSTDIKNLTLTNGVTVIPGYAFKGCSGLTSISIPNTVKTIGEYAFCNLKCIESLSLDNIETIGASAFYNNALKSVVLGPNAKSISNDAFENCRGLLKSAYPKTIPNPFGYGISVAYNSNDDIYIDGFIYGPGQEEIIFAPYYIEGEYSIDGCVTTIADKAFANCKNMTSVVIPESVSSIGSQAFVGCSALTSVKSLNQNPPVMKDNSFAGRYALATLNLSPEALSRYLATNWSLFENIGSMSGNVFGTHETGNLKYRLIPAQTADENNLAIVIPGDYASLTEVTIPERFTVSENGSTTRYYVDAIGYKAFNSASNLTTVTFNSRNASKIIGEYAFAGTKISAISIPQSVETISDHAFSNCSVLENIEIGSGVKTIGNYAFTECGKLSTVSIPGNVETIGSYAFSNCSALENIEIGSGVKTIGNYAFTKCGKLSTVSIPGNVETIGSYAFSNCSVLGNIEIGSGVKTIGNYAFTECGKLSTVSIPGNVETIGSYAFSNCSVLGNIEIGSGVKTIGNYAFSDCTALKDVEIGSETIGDFAFSDCTALKDVKIGSGVKTIGDFAFNNCSAIVSIAIPSPVETIGNGAFNSCTSLSDITVSESVKKIGDKAFFETKATKVALSEGLEYIGALAFSANADRKADPIYIPATLQSVGKDAFFNYNCHHVNISDLAAWCNIDFENENANPAAYRNGLYLNDEIIEDLVIPTSAGTVKDYAFYRNSSLKSVTISKDVQSIGMNAFYGDSNLKSIVIPGSVLSIGEYAFRNCAASPVVSFEYGSMPVEISLNAFGAPSSLAWDRPMDGFNLNVSSLKSLAIGNSVTEISNAAFKGISSLTDLKLGNSLSAIGDEAFSGCTGLTEVILPPSVETIGASAFAGGTQLTSIIMGHKVTTIGEKAFDLCPAQTVSITAQTPPDAPDNTFSNYTGNLYVQGEDAAKAYYDADYCWYQFEGLVMIEPTELKVDGDTKIIGKPGDTFQLTAKLYPENVTLPHIFWRSTNPDIATVDHNGLVTLHANLDDVMAAAELYDDDVVSPTTSCKIIGESLYANGPKIELEVNLDNANLDEIFGSGNNGKIDYTAPVEVYNLSGVRVADSVENLANGIYIIRQGSKVEKIAIK